MSPARRLAFVLLTVAACDAPAPNQPAQASANPAPLMEHTLVEPDRTLPAKPRLQPTQPQPPLSAPATAYERKFWPHWSDADRDCQDARTEVLIAESYERVTFESERRCEVASGRWQCPYTGKIIAEVHLLDVDHLVPLANAHASGASTWTKDQRRRYANDLEHAEHLVAVDYAANRSKGAKGPEAWLPPSEDFRCAYVRDWVAVKQRWRLTMNEAESAAVTNALEVCAAGQFPALPQARPSKMAKRDSSQTPPAELSEGQCCRTCNKGKACGDACIAETSTCTKPPGCACDG